MRWLVALAIATGCAHAPPGPPERKIVMEPMRFEAKPSGAVEAVDAASLFEAAGARFGAREFDAAAATYDRVVAEFPDSRYLLPALYNAGLALEGRGDRDGAARRYQQLIARAEGGACDGGARCAADLLDAYFRLGAVYVELERWQPVVELFGRVIERRDLTLSDRVEAMARRGEAQLQLGDLTAAERTFRDALALHRASETVERLDTDFFLGMAAYYLGEVAHRQFRALPVRLPEKQLAADLEAKAQLLLLAQARFFDAIRVNNVEWATAAGFQIGSLYRELYDDLVGAPTPPGVAGEAKDVYLEEVKKKVRTLLQKAISIHEQNVLMAERNGVKNEWVRRSNEQMAQLRALLAPGAPPPAQPASDEATAPPLPQPRPRDDVPRRVTM
jgi:tetratricopeptide (TPR) repeat protein